MLPDPKVTLRLMLERAGFYNYRRQYVIELRAPLPVSEPDFFFDDPNHHYEGICLYLDTNCEGPGRIDVPVSQGATIRKELHHQFYEVLEITLSELTDRDAMATHFFRLGRVLFGRDAAERIHEDGSWFSGPTSQTALTLPGPPTDLGPPSAVSQVGVRDVWQECIDLLPVKWHAVARAIRNAGVTAPTDVEWEIPLEGRVSDSLALMVWQGTNDFVALVDKGTNDARLVEAGPLCDLGKIVADLQYRIKELS